MPRKAGAIALSSPLPEMLATLRAAKDITSAPAVPLSDVKKVEKALGGEIPNDVLGYWLATGRGLGALINLTRAAREYYDGEDDRAAGREAAKKLTEKYVVIDDDYSEDDGPLCAEYGNEKDKPAKIVFWFLRKASASDPSFLSKKEAPIVSYVKWKHPDVDFKAKSDRKPVVVTLLPPPPPAAKRTVTHPRFGTGSVLQDIPPDKVEIDFGPPNGVKKLLVGDWYR